MLLTRRTLFILLLDTLLIAGATFVPVMLYLAAGYLAIVLIMVLVDRRLTPAPAAFELMRTHDQRLSLGAENLIVVRVTNRGRRTVRVLVRDEYPVMFRSDRIILGGEKARPPTRWMLWAKRATTASNAAPVLTAPGILPASLK